MTILPKKKQQSVGSHQQQQQPQQQDGRLQQHGMGNVGDSATSSNNGGGGGPLLNSTVNVLPVGTTSASVSNSISNPTQMSPFLSTSAVSAAMSTLPAPHHGVDVASAVSMGGGGLIGPGAGTSSIRRPITSSHTGCHDGNEVGDSGVLLGPHRKRAAVASASSASNHNISSPARSGQNDRSSPYRTTRRSNRGGGNGAILANASPIPAATSPSSVASTMTNAGVFNAAGVVPSGTAATSGGTAHSTRGNVSPAENRDDEGGYNSEDEYERERASYYGDQATPVPEELERKFEENLLETKGYRVKKMKEDGACLFRAVADQVYGDEEMHNVVRKLCMDYMAKNADYFNQFVTEDFAAYVERKRQEFVHGNHIEMQAMAELFNRPIQVYQYSSEPINTFHSPHETDSPAIRVSYHRNHYNSIIDPYAATIGVGLGLPQFYPGLAEKNLMRDAVHASEQDAIEEAMLEDKLRATDWEATDEQLQEQVARESYLQWLRDQEKQMKENAATRGGVSTTTTNATASGSRSPDYARPSCSKSPSRSQFCDMGDTASASVAGSSRSNGPKQWEDEDDLLKQVLALSQQEYFDCLKKQHREDFDKKPSSSGAPY